MYLNKIIVGVVILILIIVNIKGIKDAWFTKPKIILALIFLTFGCSSPEPKPTEPEYIKLHKIHLKENQKRIDSVLNERAEEEYTKDDFKFINEEL